MFFFSKKEKIVLWVLFSITFVSLFLFFSEIFYSRKAKIVFFDVGQGDAILIRTPHGRTILIDGGPDDSLLTKIDSFLGRKKVIDLVIATHPDIDHIYALIPLLHSHRINFFAHSGLTVAELEYKEIAHFLAQNKIPTIPLRTGDRIDLGDGMKLFVLSPFSLHGIRDANEASVVLLLSYRGTHILFDADAPRDIERKIVHFFGEEIRSAILKLGHHGSKTSTDPFFLDIVSPQYGILSVGCRNRYGHPHSEVLNELTKRKIYILSTCWDGDILFSFQNEGWIQEEIKK